MFRLMNADRPTFSVRPSHSLRHALDALQARANADALQARDLSILLDVLQSISQRTTPTLFFDFRGPEGVRGVLVFDILLKVPMDTHEVDRACNSRHRTMFVGGVTTATRLLRGFVLKRFRRRRKQVARRISCVCSLQILSLEWNCISLKAILSWSHATLSTRGQDDSGIALMLCLIVVSVVAPARVFMRV